jgi:tRNA A37 threonylcarbamoyladenosine dehydratase
MSLQTKKNQSKVLKIPIKIYQSNLQIPIFYTHSILKRINSTKVVVLGLGEVRGIKP